MNHNLAAIAPTLTPLAAALFTAAATADVTVTVTRADEGTTPLSGRLVIYFADPAEVRGDPSGGPFFSSPQPMLGADVNALAPNDAVTVEEQTATRFPLEGIPAGTYRVQAVLDTKRLNSRWEREPGNLYSAVGQATVLDNGHTTIALNLTSTTTAEQPEPREGVEFVEIQSKLLSEFRGTPVTLRAGVAFPANYDPSRKYPAVYTVPGFGGDHTSARPQTRSPLAQHAFRITLDPEGPNGHHLFADSANNGPVGQALVTELIPALEQQFNLVQDPDARVLRGHSSGGWSVVWLATRYPDTFGLALSSAPDPVAFDHFQTIDIYTHPNAYTHPDHVTQQPQPVPSYRRNGEVRMTVREENLMEEVIGPRNTSAQQWDSWFAVFGPTATHNSTDHPAELWHPTNGDIDNTLAQHYAAYDIYKLAQANPAVRDTLRSRVRIVCGDADSFYLERAVKQLASLYENNHSDALGGIDVVPNADHGSVLRTPPARNLQALALRLFTQRGWAPAPGEANPD